MPLQRPLLQHRLTRQNQTFLVFQSFQNFVVLHSTFGASETTRGARLPLYNRFRHTERSEVRTKRSSNEAKFEVRGSEAMGGRKKVRGSEAMGGRKKVSAGNFFSEKISYHFSTPPTAPSLRTVAPLRSVRKKTPVYTLGIYRGFFYYVFLFWFSYSAERSHRRYSPSPPTFSGFSGFLTPHTQLNDTHHRESP